MPITRDKLEQYVQTLRGSMQDIFLHCDQLVKETDDTLSEDFQVAASILEVFHKRAEEKGEQNG